MSIPTPTTKEVADNILAQLEAQLSQTIPFLPKSFNRVLSQALAAVIMILYKFGGWIFLQMFVSTAANRYFIVNGRAVNPLIEWGILIGAGRPESATQAVLLLDVTVITQIGSIPSGTQLIGATNGVTYLTSATVLLNAPIVTISALAVSDQSGGGGAGTIGNLPVGSIVTFANTQLNVSQPTVVSGATTTGADAESTELYRQRIIDLFNRRPQGGAYIDYGVWGLEPAGIENIYPFTGDPAGDYCDSPGTILPGTVLIYVEAVEGALTPDGIPTLAQLDEVEDSINYDQAGLATRRPANAKVRVFPISRVALNVDVSGIDVSPLELAQTQADITSAITEYYLSRENYIDGYTIGVNQSRALQNDLIAIVSQIVNAHGGIFSTVVQKLGSTLMPIYCMPPGVKAKIGTLVFN